MLGLRFPFSFAKDFGDVSPAPEDDSGGGDGDGKDAGDDEEWVVEVVAVLVVHDVEHPEEVECPPGIVSASVDLSGFRVDVDVGILGVLEIDSVCGQWAATVFAWWIGFDEFNVFDCCVVQEIIQSQGFGLFLGDVFGGCAGDVESGDELAFDVADFPEWAESVIDEVDACDFLVVELSSGLLEDWR